VPGHGHRRSFAGSRPQTSLPRFPVAALCQRRRRSQTAATVAFARAFARLENDLRTSIGEKLSVPAHF